MHFFSGHYSYIFFSQHYSYFACTLSSREAMIYSAQLSPSVVSDSLWPHGQQHARLPCSSPTPGVYSNSCPLSQWCQPTISSSVIPFSSHLQSFPALGSFPMSQFFASGGQSVGVSASTSVLPMNIQDWLPLGLTSWIFYALKIPSSRLQVGDKLFIEKGEKELLGAGLMSPWFVEIGTDFLEWTPLFCP